MPEQNEHIRVLITGCSGFLGSRLASLFMQLAYVIGIDIVDIPVELKGIEFHKLDISNETISKAFKDIDILIHCAATVPITRVGRKRHLEVNALGTYNMLNIRPRKFVHISSSAVYGSPNGVLTEHSPHRYIEEYGESKDLAEQYCFYAMDRGQNITILRPRTIIGQTRMGILEYIYRRVSKNKPLYLIGKGTNRFQLLSLDDLVNAITTACLPIVGGDFNLGTDKFTTLQEDLEEFIYTVGSKSKVILIPKTSKYILRLLDIVNLAPFTPWHYDTIFNDFYFDISKAQRFLKWYPHDSNVSMLIDSYKWYLYHNNGKGYTPHTSKLKMKLLELI